MGPEEFMVLLAHRHNPLTEQIIGAAIEVHRVLGPGLLESVYACALGAEMSLRGISFQQEIELPISYKHLSLPGRYRMDFLVEETVVLELKAIDKLLPVHEAQVLSYLRLGKFPVGLLINFNSSVLVRGIRRILL